MAFTQHSSKRLTFDDAVHVWRLRKDGWYQHRIAAEFAVNPGRINDVLKERTHLGSREKVDERGAQ